MKTRFLLLSIVAVLASPVLASQGIVTGKSTLKLSEGGSQIRQARKELAAVEKEITETETKLQQSRSQAAIAQGLQGTNNMKSATFQAQANAYELQIDDLKSRRAQLQNELTSQK